MDNRNLHPGKFYQHLIRSMMVLLLLLDCSINRLSESELMERYGNDIVSDEEVADSKCSFYIVWYLASYPYYIIFGLKCGVKVKHTAFHPAIMK